MFLQVGLKYINVAQLMIEIDPISNTTTYLSETASFFSNTGRIASTTFKQESIASLCFKCESFCYAKNFYLKKEHLKHIRRDVQNFILPNLPNSHSSSKILAPANPSTAPLTPTTTTPGSPMTVNTNSSSGGGSGGSSGNTISSSTSSSSNNLNLPSNILHKLTQYLKDTDDIFKSLDSWDRSNRDHHSHHNQPPTTTNHHNDVQINFFYISYTDFIDHIKKEMDKLS